MRTIIYPGTFDPITKGHADIARRATRLFDRVIVAVAVSTKQTVFSIEERVALASEIFNHDENIIVSSFEHKLLIEYVREVDGIAILRGIRAVSDFDVEFQMAAMNRVLAEEIETIFMSPDETFAYISSTLVREIALVGGDTSPFVAPQVSIALKEKMHALHNTIET